MRGIRLLRLLIIPLLQRLPVLLRLLIHGIVCLTIRLLTIGLPGLLRIAFRRLMRLGLIHLRLLIRPLRIGILRSILRIGLLPVGSLSIGRLPVGRLIAPLRGHLTGRVLSLYPLTRRRLLSPL